MDTPSASIRARAGQLLAVEAATQSPADPHVHEVVRVCEKLRVSLAPFVGADGFAALLRRAVALARAEVSYLQPVKAMPDGCLDGIETFAADPEKDAEAALAITAHLLGLLVTFIGESLTLRLMGAALPDTSQTILESEDLS